MIELKGVTKRFGPVLALEGVSFELRAGEIHALIGENGAGKSTLMKILSGVYPAGEFEGEILVQGAAARFHAPRDAEKAGIAIIHQELAAFPHLTVAENLFVGHWPARASVVSWAGIRESAGRWLREVGADCSPEDRMGDLSVGQQQLVEIAKALSRETRVLILDEPTSALTPREAENLFRVLKRLREEGKALVYISHKLDEVFALADRITVLRDGRSVHSARASQLTPDSLVAWMVGRPLDRLFPPLPERKAGARALLKVEGVRGVSFELREGEILGFAGLLGAGRTELMKALCGDEDYRAGGSAWLRDRSFRPRGPRRSIRERVVYISEDRKRESILPERSLDENAALSRLASASLFRLFSPARELERSAGAIRRFRTRCAGAEQEIRQLSGGNQQKVVLARALELDPEVVILDEPTRGIDVGARYEIYEILFELARAGKGVIVVSSDLVEIMGLCDRIIVLSEGEAKGCLSREQFSQESIMKLATT